MPVLLQPKAPYASDAILVGDPGRALLLAQELLEQPKMCNHARGLWGYVGLTTAGHELTIQATGIGAPSAAAALADLAELGVRRAVRVGTATALGERDRLGDLLLVAEAEATEGSATAFGVGIGEAVAPDPMLLDRLAQAVAGEARAVRIVSVDTVPDPRASAGGAAAADMQTLSILARGRALGVAGLEDAAKRAGRAASAALSP
ncbi:MAG TPA: hypothetical protein VEQ41_03000 [Solirubrobacterales bacterium]|nr:hypothetical protein [Solirubrobacterales bacterium]